MRFGRQAGGGRRAAVRDSLTMRVEVTTRAHSQSAVLTDISRTGAKLRGRGLPAEGSDLLVRIGLLEAFATVAWSREDACGLEFDVPLGDDQVRLLKRERKVILRGRNPDEMLAAEDWVSGLAR